MYVSQASKKVKHVCKSSKQVAGILVSNPVSEEKSKQTRN